MFLREKKSKIYSVLIIIISLLLFSAHLYAQENISPGTLIEVRPTGIVSKSRIRQEGLPLFSKFVIPAAQYQVQSYRIVYRSQDVDGSEADIVAQLFVPLMKEAQERPLYVFGSGTTGIADHCAPSRECPKEKCLGYYRGYMLAYAGQGFISIIPDYLGFNDPDKPQRYFSKIAEAHVMLDAVRAVYNFFEKINPLIEPSQEVFLAGYSQGGHAAFAAADMWKEYAPELPISGIIGYGSTTDVSALFREGPYYAPHILYNYSTIYPDIDPSDYLQEKWARTLKEDVQRMCVDDFQRYYPYNGKLLYKPDFYTALYQRNLQTSFPTLYRRLAENMSGLSGHGLPALIIQGEEDIIIQTPSQTDFVNQLCRMGSSVRFINLKDVRHRHTRPAGFQASVLWMERIMEGDEPESDCALYR